MGVKRDKGDIGRHFGIKGDTLEPRETFGSQRRHFGAKGDILEPKETFWSQGRYLGAIGDRRNIRSHLGANGYHRDIWEPRSK